MPFRWIITWTDGQSTIELSEVRANAPIDDARFAEPAPALVKQAVNLETTLVFSNAPPLLLSLRGSTNWILRAGPNP